MSLPSDRLTLVVPSGFAVPTAVASSRWWCWGPRARSLVSPTLVGDSAVKDAAGARSDDALE